MDPFIGWAMVALALLVLAAAWWGWWGRVYRLRAPRPRMLHVRCADGWELAVYHRPAAARRWREPVVLCHGLAANHYYFDFDPPHSVAGYLAEAGFDCFTVEWRGTGRSRRPPRGRHFSDYTVDDHIRFDGPALLDLALGRTGADKAFWLGHSLGGVVGYGVAQSEDADKLKGLLALGAPGFIGFGKALRRMLWWGRLAAWPRVLRYELMMGAAAPLFGWMVVPYSDYVLNPRNVAPALQRQLVRHSFASIGRKMMLQLSDWVENDALRSLDRAVDYREGLRNIRVPALIMCGSEDKLAPPEAVRANYERLGSTDKALIEFGHARGDRHQYGHGDLIFGRHAPEEVYPVIRAWLEARATPL